MTSIHIKDLETFGFDLFSDEESYLNEIGNDGFNSIHGGISPTIIPALESAAASIAISVSVRQLHDKKDAWSPIGWL